jgi:hypothetical protein
MQDLEGYLAVALQIVGEEDDGHSGTTDSTFDRVVAGEDGPGSFQYVFHCASF